MSKRRTSSQTNSKTVSGVLPNANSKVARACSLVSQTPPLIRRAVSSSQAPTLDLLAVWICNISSCSNLLTLARELISSRAMGETETSSSESEIGTRSGRESGVLGDEEGEDDTELIPGGDSLLGRRGVDGVSGCADNKDPPRNVSASELSTRRRRELPASEFST